MIQRPKLVGYFDVETWETECRRVLKGRWGRGPVVVKGEKNFFKVYNHSRYVINGKV